MENALIRGKQLNKYVRNYVVFDLETTGISSKKDAIIEISAVKVENGQATDEFSTFVNPGRPIPYAVANLTGIHDSMVRKAPKIETALRNFLDFVGDFILIGHNIKTFDLKFISRDADRYFGQTLDNDYIDTLVMAKKYFPQMAHHRLGDMAQRYGISTEGAHRAINDCRMNMQVYEQMVREIFARSAAKTQQPAAKTDYVVTEQETSQAEGNRTSGAESSRQIPPAKRSLPKIRCVVERITFQSPETGYTVLKTRVKGYSDLVPVIGNLLDVNVGSVLLVEGNWKVDTKYGRQFVAENWEETLPATVYGIEKYLGSGLIKGVGPKFAKRIVQSFGTDTLDVIEMDIERLEEIPGIGKKRIKLIAESWAKQKEIKNIMLFLQDHGVNTSYAAKIYKQYGNDAIAVVKENPFRLADDIWGIGFKTADSIAEKLGFGKESFVRLRSGLMYTLSELSDEGHVYAEKEQLIKKATELLEAEESFIIMTMDQMLADKDLIKEEILVNVEAEAAERGMDSEMEPTMHMVQNSFEHMDQAAEMESNGGMCHRTAIYLPPFYYAEVGVANHLKKLNETPATDKLYVQLTEARKQTGNESLSVNVEKIEERVHMVYDEVQADAIRAAATAKVMVLTGGPGTGKTTTTQGIIAAYQTYGLKILLAAPTGRAAKRMSEATGMEAKTIHRLLECKPPEGYQKNEENPLEGDVLIIDECSMIDIVLMNSLLKAVPQTMRLILVGDIDQLPSVGAGNVLRDIIDSGVFPVIRLTRIFRQAQTSRIIMNAHRINQGQMPDISNGKNTDFFFMEQEDPEATVDEIVRLVQTKLSRYYQTPSSQIQVLTPMQRGVVGAANLNLMLQQALNPEGEGLRRSGFVYRVNDKVMQIKNNYDKEVFNGDIGIISSVDMVDRSLTVDFDGRLVPYDGTELDELVHAYATTIHKAQGSEYPIVVMPILMNHYVMLQRNLIYTGITRAKKILVLVGTKKALHYAVRNVTVHRRNTMLKERLSEIILL